MSYLMEWGCKSKQVGDVNDDLKEMGYEPLSPKRFNLGACNY